VNLSPHFTLEELTHSDAAARNGWDNTPNDAEKANLTRLAALLEQVKAAVVGKPVMVNSAYRSKQVNDAVGSKDSSQHRIGCAADIRVPGMTPREVVLACIGAGLPFDQIILEFDAWTHISVPNEAGLAPRGSKLIIDKLGTRNFS
jgi:zinc D-Ala-D-Ala carboxypeptidase